MFDFKRITEALVKCDESRVAELVQNALDQGVQNEI